MDEAERRLAAIGDIPCNLSQMFLASPVPNVLMHYYSKTWKTNIPFYPENNDGDPYGRGCHGGTMMMSGKLE